MDACLMLLPLLLAAAGPTDAGILALERREDGRACLPDGGLCLQILDSADGGALAISAPEIAADVAQPLPALADGGTAELWPHLIALSALSGDPPGVRRYAAGILDRQMASYSGGGGSAARLHLYELVLGADPRLGTELLDVDWDSSLLIRACFSEQDARDRLDACQDEYDFRAELSAAPPTEGSRFPVLTYRAVATAFPRTSRRSQDNSAVKLKHADLVRAEDPGCTYRRTLRYNPATLRYEMDRPPPDCSDYMAP